MKIIVVGCGVMGSAFARHFAHKNTLYLCDRELDRAQALAKRTKGHAKKITEIGSLSADLLLLAVKPKDLSSVAQTMGSAAKEIKMVVSMLSGTSTIMLKKHFPNAHIIRLMPNLGLIAKQGVIGIVDHPSLKAKEKKKVQDLLAGMGLCLWIPEDKIDAITALSGSGVGFVLLMIEAMIDGGIYLGFSAAEAQEIVLKTMEGAIALVKESGKHPAELKQQICSPGGTTIAGLKVMEEAGVRAGIMQTLIACYEKVISN